MYTDVVKRRKTQREYMRRWRAANRDYYNAWARAYNNKYRYKWGAGRRRNLLRKYGLTPEQYNMLREAQGGVCKICGNPPKIKPLYVDHDHLTKAVRGLLCPRCNSMLGWYEKVGEAQVKKYLGQETCRV